MAQQTYREEELVVPTGGTADTSDKELIVGCTHTSTESSRASLIGSLRSGEEETSPDLEPGRSFLISSSERSYRIVLLSVASEGVRVRVIGTKSR